MFLYLSDYKIGVCLDSQVYETKASNVFFLTNNKRSGLKSQYTSGEYSILIPEIPFKLNINKLMCLFNHKYFKYILEQISTKDSNEIKNSIVNYYLTTNIPSASVQTIGSVTSIEILLKNSRKYDEIEKRIRILLGDRFHSDFLCNDKHYGVLTKRHNIIHDGQNSDESDAFRAIKLYIELLINYSYLFRKYKNRDKICKFLDLAYTIKYLAEPKTSNKKINYEIEKELANFPFRDWVIQKLIAYYNICSSDGIKEFEYNFSLIVESYSQLRKIPIEESYIKIVENIYYNDDQILEFKDFYKYYNENYDIIKPQVTNNLMWQNFIL